MALLAAAREPEHWLTAGALVPDDVVYCGPRVWAAEAADEPADWLAALPDEARSQGRLAVAVRGQGVVLAGPNLAYLEAMEDSLLAHVLIRRLIARRGEPLTLPAAEVEYLHTMEHEHYRRLVPGGRLGRA
jgi:hypothetical protein